MKNNLQRQKNEQYNQMKDKTKGQLIKELAEMRQRIIEQEAERKRVKKVLRLHMRELSTLNKLARSLSGSLGLSEVMKTGLDSFLEATDLHLGAMYLIDETSGKLLPVIHKGIAGEFAEAISRIPLGMSATGKVAETGKVVAITHTLRDERLNGCNKLYLESEKIRCLVSVPLKSRGKTIGVIDAGAKISRDFSVEDIHLLEALGSLIGIAIEHAQLIEKMSQISTTDELTGLFNRRHFDEVLEIEIYRSQRYGSSFSLVMGALDGFKKYNSKFGQTSGDSVLKAFAQILKAGLRKTDVACHYGNSEFFIILPATDANRARKIIERIRLKFSQMPEGEHTFREHVFGLSAGIAEFPQVATTADGLICMAECALYYAKMRGDNRSVLISDLETQLTKEPNMERLREVYDMVEYVETRDPITYGHSENVAIISELIGKAMGLSIKELADLRAAALLHDVGKVGIPDSILTKPCKLTENEWELMKTHSEAGAKIVGCTEGLANLAPIIRHHHEWYDGTGYPDGLKGEEIPLGAGIISIADAYDTMTSERPYSKAMLQESALDELRRCAGTQFDPRLVDIFVFGVKIQAILQKKNLDEMKLLEAKRQLDSDKPKKYIQDTGTFNFN